MFGNKQTDNKEKRQQEYHDPELAVQDQKINFGFVGKVYWISKELMSRDDKLAQYKLVEP